MNDSPPGPLETARDLQKALEGMTGQLREVLASIRRSKRIIAGLVVSLAVDVALTVIVTITAAQAHHASDQANATVAQLHATQIAACQDGNQTRAQEIQLWEHLAGLTKINSDRQRSQVAAIIGYVRRVFAPKDCAAVYRLP